MKRRGGDVCKRGHDKTVVGRRKDGRCLECLKQDRLKHESSIPEEVRKANSRRRTQESVRRKRERLAGAPRPDVCEVCTQPGYGQQGIVFDHDHKTGQFRGWLCNSCNVVLGYVQDDVERLMQLALYLERRRAK
jgi:hypothetical protein